VRVAAGSIVVDVEITGLGTLTNRFVREGM
jgi:hypothetical protein